MPAMKNCPVVVYFHMGVAMQIHITHLLAARAIAQVSRVFQRNLNPQPNSYCLTNESWLRTSGGKLALSAGEC